jgi:tetratricopeptide (TPR) repeat protein
MTYSSHQVAELLNLPQAQVRAYARSGVLSPEWEGGAYRFGFQDLVVLRTATTLVAQQVAHNRVRRAMRAVQRVLPAGRSLTEVQFTLDDMGITAHDGEMAWDPESGQIRLDFVLQSNRVAVTSIGTSPEHWVRPHAPPGAGDIPDEEIEEADIWFEVACELEETSPVESELAYRRALISNPFHVEALTNLGRLRQIQGHAEEAVELYRAAIMLDPDASTAAFNLGVALEDLGRFQDAIEVYVAALERDPSLVDAHFNLGCLYEQSGDTQAALRHLRTYKALRER